MLLAYPVLKYTTHKAVILYSKFQGQVVAYISLAAAGYLAFCQYVCRPFKKIKPLLPFHR